MKLYSFMALVLALSLFSCGGASSDSEASEDGEDMAQSDFPRTLQNATKWVDLNDYYVNASIAIPDETQGESEIMVNDFGEIHVSVGEIYHVVFAEMIEGDLNTYISTLSEDLVYTNEIVDQGEDYVLYKSTIADSPMDPEFHFYATKTIDGIAFEIHDYNEEGGYAESITRRMLDSVNNLKSNNSPS